MCLLLSAEPRIRECTSAQEYVRLGRVIVLDDWLSLPNGQPFPNDGAGRGLRHSIDTWLGAQAQVTPTPAPHLTVTLPDFAERIWFMANLIRSAKSGTAIPVVISFPMAASDVWTLHCLLCRQSLRFSSRRLPGGAEASSDGNVYRPTTSDYDLLPYKHLLPS